MAFLVVVLALLLTGPACGGPSGADRAELEALMVESRESHAATVAAHETVAARAAERTAAHVAAAEARAARGEPLCVDVDTLTNNAAASRVAWATQIARVKTHQASVLTQREDAIALETWDLHFPYETGAGRRRTGTGGSPGRVAGRVRGARLHESHRELANLRQ